MKHVDALSEKNANSPGSKIGVNFNRQVAKDRTDERASNNVTADRNVHHPHGQPYFLGAQYQYAPPQGQPTQQHHLPLQSPPPHQSHQPHQPHHHPVHVLHAVVPHPLVHQGQLQSPLHNVHPGHIHPPAVALPQAVASYARPVCSQPLPYTNHPPPVHNQAIGYQAPHHIPVSTAPVGPPAPHHIPVSTAPVGPPAPMLPPGQAAQMVNVVFNYGDAHVAGKPPHAMPPGHSHQQESGIPPALSPNGTPVGYPSGTPLSPNSASQLGFPGHCPPSPPLSSSSSSSADLSTALKRMFILKAFGEMSARTCAQLGVQPSFKILRYLPGGAGVAEEWWDCERSLLLVNFAQLGGEPGSVGELCELLRATKHDREIEVECGEPAILRESFDNYDVMVDTFYEEACDRALSNSRHRQRDLQAKHQLRARRPPSATAKLMQPVIRARDGAARTDSKPLGTARKNLPTAERRISPKKDLFTPEKTG